MKKQYINPSLRIHNVEIESLLETASFTGEASTTALSRERNHSDSSTDEDW